jgi:hypothetical protein
MNEPFPNPMVAGIPDKGADEATRSAVEGPGLFAKRKKRAYVEADNFRNKHAGSNADTSSAPEFGHGAPVSSIGDLQSHAHPGTEIELRVLGMLCFTWRL